MAKKLKHFAYRIGWGEKRGDVYFIAATSQKQVIELMGKVGVSLSLTEIRNFCGLWGIEAEEAMKAFGITEPCVYLGKRTQAGLIEGTLKKLI